MYTIVSRFLSVQIDENMGGSITSIISHTKQNDEWIYFDSKRRNPKKSLEVYDDVWCGGFEELFPNDAAEIVEGKTLIDHGELWREKWEVINSANREITIEYKCKTVPAIVKKTISVSDIECVCTIDYSILNTSNEPFPYLFKLHPALRIEPGDKILLPGGNVIPVDLGFSNIIGRKDPFKWPMSHSKSNHDIDISIIPDKFERKQEFVYVSDIPEGWCGLKRKRSGEKFILHYPQDIFPYCWFFMALGGWRDHYTVVMEPCTNIPKEMNVAIANGTCAILKPNETRNFSISLSVENK